MEEESIEEGVRREVGGENRRGKGRLCLECKIINKRITRKKESYSEHDFWISRKKNSRYEVLPFFPHEEVGS